MNSVSWRSWTKHFFCCAPASAWWCFVHTNTPLWTEIESQTQTRHLQTHNVEAARWWSWALNQFIIIITIIIIITPTVLTSICPAKSWNTYSQPELYLTLTSDPRLATGEQKDTRIRFFFYTFYLLGWDKTVSVSRTQVPRTVIPWTCFWRN